MKTAESRRLIQERSDLNAFISLTDETGEGTVVGVKDVIDVRGTVTTGGGIILPAVPSLEDAPVVRAMRSVGCVIVGKTNLHEWAFGVTSANPHYGPVVNPRYRDRIPGGSSGGSAAAVAAGLVDWAVGTDTGGSIRTPAAMCGVVGFKPTIGSIDTTGVIPLSRTLDTLGPLAPDVATAARAFDQMRGISADGKVDARPKSFTQLRLGVIHGWAEDLDEASSAQWHSLTNRLPLIDFPSRTELNEVGFMILLTEGANFHRRWIETMPERYGTDVLEPLRRGLNIPRHDYVEALLRQSRLRWEADAAMTGFDALIVPATRISRPRTTDQFERADLTGYARPFNTTGQPVVCLPVGPTDNQMGVQVVGRHGKDAELLRVAQAIETEWSRPKA